MTSHHTLPPLELVGWDNTLHTVDPHAQFVVLLAFGFLGPWHNEGKMAESHKRAKSVTRTTFPYPQGRTPRAHCAMTASYWLMAGTRSIVLDVSCKEKQHSHEFVQLELFIKGC